MEFDLRWHLVRPEGGDVNENAMVSNTPKTFEQVTGWLGMDKDTIFCIECI